MDKIESYRMVNGVMYAMVLAPGYSPVGTPVGSDDEDHSMIPNRPRYHFKRVAWVSNQQIVDLTDDELVCDPIIN